MLHRACVAMFVVIAACDWPVPGPGWPTDPHPPSDAGPKPDMGTAPDAPLDDGGVLPDAPGDGASPDAPPDDGGVPPDDGGVSPDAPGDGGSPDAPPDGGTCDHLGPAALPVVPMTPFRWLVVADVNRDGRDDLVAVGRLAVSIALGLGGGRFEPAIDTPIALEPHADAGRGEVVDVNRDGAPDIVTATGRVSVLLGNGDGTFQAQVDYPVRGTATIVNLGDVNGDGDPDAIVSSASGDEAHVSILLGRGDGTFGPAVAEYRVRDFRWIVGQTAVSIVDLNGDGKPDLVVPEFEAIIGLRVLIGNGDGTFQRGAGYEMAGEVSAHTLADVSGDGVLDLVATSHLDEPPIMAVFFGRGDGTFGERQDRATAIFPSWVAVRDVDGDGGPDIITMHLATREVLIQRSSGGDPVHVRVGFGLPVVTDISGDGKLDLVVGIGNAGVLGHVRVLLGTGDGTFLDGPIAPRPIPFFSASDLNGDGMTDFLGPVPLSPGTFSHLWVQLGNGDGSFRPPVSYDTFSEGSIDAAPTGAETADVNHDGKLDIVTLNDQRFWDRAKLTVLFGNGDGTFQPSIPTQIMPGADSIALADLNRDAHPDVILTYGSGSVRVLLNNGIGTFRRGAIIATTGSARTAVPADLDGDGTPDLAVAIGSDTVSVLLNKGDGTFKPRVDYRVSYPHRLVVADVNGDARPDLLASGLIMGNVKVLLGVGDGTFVTHGEYPTTAMESSMVVADATGDGKPDLVLYSQQTWTLGVAPGNGDGSFQPYTEFGAPGTREEVAVVDITGDGKSDILVSGGPVFIAECLP